jgi:Zn-dependent protease with chaperone function
MSFSDNSSPFWKKELITFIFAIIFGLSVASAADAAVSDEIAEEIALGRKVADQIEQNWERISDPVKVARLNMLLSRLISHLERNLPYEVRIIREETPNAFSLPGGIIFLTTGMLDFVHSDSEIAAILAHELIHADRRHVMIQLARNQKISLVALAVMIASKGQAIPAILANVAQVTISNSYSRDLEREADIKGLDVLYAAEFPPSAMVTVMEGLSEEEMKKPYIDPGIYRDHPEISDRISYLMDHIRENNWPLERKVPLNALRSSVGYTDDKVQLLIDDTLIIEREKDQPAVSVLKGIADKLNHEMQLELAPYDIQVVETDTTKILRIRNSIIIREPLPIALPELQLIRDRIIEALLEAQSIHPTVDFMR